MRRNITPLSPSGCIGAPERKSFALGMGIGATFGSAVGSPEAHVASLFAPSDAGGMWDAADPASLRAERDGSGVAAPGDPVGAWVDKRYMAGAPVAQYVVVAGLTNPLAAPGIHLVAASNNARPVNVAGTVQSDGVDDILSGPFIHSGANLYAALRITMLPIGEGTRYVSFGPSGSVNDTRADAAFVYAGSGRIRPRRENVSAIAPETLEGQTYTAETLFTPSQIAIAVDGAAETSVAYTPSLEFNIASLNLFARQDGAANIATRITRMLVLSRIPSTAERATIREWLSQ